MHEIRKAFLAAYRKRTGLWLLLILPPTILLSMKISGYFFTTVESCMTAALISIIAIIVRSVVIRNPKFLKGKILKALYDPKQYEIFVSTIEAELSHVPERVKIFSDKKIYICSSKTWFVLITPNGSFICMQKNIRKITTIVRESNSREYLMIGLSDGRSFLFPYPELEELLIEWKDIERGERKA